MTSTKATAKVYVSVAFILKKYYFYIHRDFSISIYPSNTNRKNIRDSAKFLSKKATERYVSFLFTRERKTVLITFEAF